MDKVHQTITTQGVRRYLDNRDEWIGKGAKEWLSTKVAVSRIFPGRSEENLNKVSDSKASGRDLNL
jgi:hypothetical protein